MRSLVSNRKEGGIHACASDPLKRKNPARSLGGNDNVPVIQCPESVAGSGALNRGLPWTPDFGESLDLEALDRLNRIAQTEGAPSNVSIMIFQSEIKWRT
jgi:hypothetical protein